MLGPIKPRVDLGFDIQAREGVVVAGRIRNAKSTYNVVEDVDGRLRMVMPGDVVAGVLGHRDALRGYVGHVPESVKPGDMLNILSQSAVIGKCTSFNPDLGSPFEFEVLGAVMTYPKFGERVPRPAVVERSSELDNPTLPDKLPPIVVMAGVTMQGGKTTAVCHLVRQFKRSGFNVVAGKCTGISRLGDTLEMKDFGASKISGLQDFGIITTTPADSQATARAVIRTLAKENPDVILLELGDGLLGTYGVAEILRDEQIRKVFSSVILCAADPVGAWGGVTLLRERFGIKCTVVTGPVTDNRGGAAAVEREFGLAAFNARKEAKELADVVMKTVGMEPKVREE